MSDLSRILQRPVLRDLPLAWRKVSALGLGTVKLGRNQSIKYPSGDGFRLPTDSEVELLLDLALDCGINLLDTAPAYGSSEERLGALMKGRRPKFFLVTKTGEEFCSGRSEYNFTAQHTRMSVERSLKRLRTDFLDCVLVHSSADDVSVIGNTAALEVLAILKAQGKIGQIGVSVHTVDGGRLAADVSDCVMVSYSKNDTAQRPVIEHAHANGKAVLIKKGLSSGHVGTGEQAAEHIRFVLGTAGVTTLVFGSISPANIRANARALAA